MTQLDARNLDHAGATNNCSSGKRAYNSRRDAKKAAHQVRVRTGEHVRPYWCDECGRAHVGHLPHAVRRGECSADQWYHR